MWTKNDEKHKKISFHNKVKKVPSLVSFREYFALVRINIFMKNRSTWRLWKHIGRSIVRFHENLINNLLKTFLRERGISSNQRAFMCFYFNWIFSDTRSFLSYGFERTKSNRFNYDHKHLKKKQAAKTIREPRMSELELERCLSWRGCQSKWNATWNEIMKRFVPSRALVNCRLGIVSCCHSSILRGQGSSRRREEEEAVTRGSDDVNRGRTLGDGVERALFLLWAQNRYNLIFLALTYAIPVTGMIVCYSVMGRVLWGAKQIGELSQRHVETLRSKRKVTLLKGASLTYPLPFTLPSKTTDRFPSQRTELFASFPVFSFSLRQYHRLKKSMSPYSITYRSEELDAPGNVSIKRTVYALWRSRSRRTEVSGPSKLLDSLAAHSGRWYCYRCPVFELCSCRPTIISVLNRGKKGMPLDVPQKNGHDSTEIRRALRALHV